MFTEDDAKDAILRIANLKGVERAKLIERMLRLETRHFKSLQYQMSGSAGMEDGKWKDLPKNSYTTFQMKDNHLTGAKQMRTFIKWNSVYDFCVYLSDYIDRHKGNYARWNDTRKERQIAYEAKLKGIRNRFI
jgi:hypothetical protein